ncbi:MULTISPECIES: Mov34/MPN/PAD-1 family protein [unclassified Nostoc]|uniref:Mov34/MPN/PAD-1 family protein n=1 Tax=unclassified Nostoc TaxID=2593658 RepID=UPI0021AB4114|nr:MULTISPECIES: Mov34/MPN/PAD-1 family protein [unclassified Nostoc]
MNDLEFWSEDKRLGLKIHRREVSQLLKVCARAGVQETGGILVGFYTESHNCAVITAISDAPSDSHSGHNWFHRGTNGLQRWLNHLWNKDKQYYVGEWHFHPFSNPNPSQIDINEMQKIGDSYSYQCPEPLLLIIGGDPNIQWDIKVYIFPRNRPLVELIKCF